MSLLNHKNLLAAGKIIKDFFLPEDLTATPEAFTKIQLQALADKRTISKMLFYRSYIVDTESDLGFFQMHDGRAGIAFIVNPPVYLTEKTENVILNILSAIVKDDTVVHISVLAGRDVKDILERFDESTNCEKVNIKYPEKLKEIASLKTKSFQDWTEQSMMGRDADFRVRNFTHVISILFPLGIPKESIVKQSNEIYGILKENFSARVANDDDMVAFVQEILNPAKGHYDKTGDPVTTISKRMSRGAQVRADDKSGTVHLKDGWMAKVLTTEKYPKQVDSFSYQGIFFDPLGGDYQIKLPCPFFLSLIIRFKDIEAQRKKVLSKAQWNVGQLSGLPMIIEKKKPEIKERRKEAENVIDYINFLGEIPLDAAWSLTVFENNNNRLEQYISLIKSSFSSFPGRWIVREETFANIAFYTTLMSLPLNYSEAFHFIVDKFDKNFKSNNAQIAPLIGDYKGMGHYPTHLYVGRTGQIIPMDIFASNENYNITVVGPMGTGKSFWTNNFLVSGLRAGWQVRMIDFGRSYLKTSEAIGGQFVEFDKKSTICMNFFTHLQTIKTVDENGKEETQIEPEEFDAIIPIIGLMMGLSLKEIYKNTDSSSSEKLELSVIATFLAHAVKEAFRRHGHEAGMREVGAVLNEMRKMKIEENSSLVNDESEILSKMVTSLEAYANPSGQYYKYFNGANNINLDSSYFTLELDDIATSPMMPVVAMSFLQRTAQEAFIGYLKDKTTARIIGVDEAHKVLGNEIFAKFFDDFGRRIRKYRGIPILITQSLEDFFVNRSASVFFELASFKIFLKQKGESIENASRKSYVMLNSFQHKLMDSVSLKSPHYNEFFLRHGGTDLVAILKVNADEYWTYTTNPLDRAKTDEIMRKYDLTMQDALWVLARTTDGMPLDKSLYELSKKASKKGKKDWDAFFHWVLENNAVYLAKQDVLKGKDKSYIEFEELYMRVKDKNGVLHNPGVFLIAAQDKGYYSELSRHFLAKTYDYIVKNSANSNTAMVYSINVDYLDIKNEDYVHNLFLMVGKLGKDKNKLILELKLDYETRENFDTVLNFARRAQKLGISIGFDNVILDQIDFKSFIALSPKMFKIDAKSIQEIGEGDKLMFKNFVSSLIVSGISVVATKIESQEDIEDAKELGIELFQGWFVSRTEDIESQQ